MNSLRAIGEKDGSIAAIAGRGDHFCGQKNGEFLSFSTFSPTLFLSHQHTRGRVGLIQNGFNY